MPFDMTLHGFRTPRGEVLSDCRRYVYWTWRCWDRFLPTMGVIVATPVYEPLQDELPTVYHIGYADKTGHGSIVTAHVFSYRSRWNDTHKAAIDPVGPNNWQGMPWAFRNCDAVVCAWGWRARFDDMGRLLLLYLHTTELSPKLRYVSLMDDGLPATIRWANYDEPLKEF